MTTSTTLAASGPYQVRLPIFEGPLDLLLHLIEREELDITAISLASVADQFVAHLSVLRNGDVHAGFIADFLVIAARLLLIKSRLLLPKPPALEDGEEEDPGEALVRRLREYKRFKHAAQWLRQTEQAGLRSHLRVAPPPALESRLDMDSVSVDLLIAALRQVALVEPEIQSADPLVSPRKVTVQEKMALIENLVSSGRPVPFGDVVNGGSSRVEIVVSLWAVLEMIKRNRLRAVQSELFGEIILMEATTAGDAEE